jgi:hypothetical protein
MASRESRKVPDLVPVCVHVAGGCWEGMSFKLGTKLSVGMEHSRVGDAE